MTTKGKRYPAEVRERREYPSEWAAITSIARKCGMTAETLRKWVRQAEVGGGCRPGVSSEEAARIKELERENEELRRANEMPVDTAQSNTSRRELDRPLNKNRHQTSRSGSVTG